MNWCARMLVCWLNEYGEMIAHQWKAQTVANVYKERWCIELFFKQIKQNLKIKSFIGTNTPFSWLTGLPMTKADGLKVVHGVDVQNSTTDLGKASKKIRPAA